MNFKALTNKVKSKLSSWQIPLLSQVGGNTSTKSIAFVIPVYNKSIPRLPTKISDSNDKMLRAFWWGENGGKRKFNTIKWAELCKPILDGGFRVRDTKSNNLPLLAKTCCRCLNKEELLC